MMEGNTMSELKPRIHDEANGLDYILAGDYYIPAIELPVDDERPIGKWGRMHRAYLEETNPLLLNHLILTGKLRTYLADLNEQAQNRYRLIIKQMTDAEGVDEDLKRRSQWEWIKALNGIVSRAEEIIRSEMINI
ncbi:TnpV protein [Bacteroides caecimuris]|uniref:TnpV protein n=1 Tax=Bacteroides caecimuris TaxID=1796613 RepID=UPI003D2FFE34